MMEEWASSGVTIPVQLLPLKVDGGCASLTSSTLECEVTESTQTEDQTTSVLAGVVVVLVMVIVGIAIVIAIILTVYVRRAKQQPIDEPE